MADTRKKNILWKVATDDGSQMLTLSGGPAHLAVLMDIRDQLMDLNRLLRCQDFTAIPETLKQIRRNTAKPRKKTA